MKKLKPFTVNMTLILITEDLSVSYFRLIAEVVGFGKFRFADAEFGGNGRNGFAALHLVVV